ncbi:hypothetical protein LWI29_012561 [Acer saccharum]|uniref:Reverse transcriptase Ty1/copia-type domain-containing protein n=1 Tax=Acer saccharum TaxID=4024 RepID=A0AA39RRK1_ACESA|nr:hypothetical protein LWI29_012561 [Acer saccharum]
MPVHTLPIHDDGTFKFSPPTSSIPHETEPHEDSILSVAYLDNEMSPDAPPVSDSSPVSIGAQPDPPIRSVRSRQPPSYLKNYHCPTLPHVANLVQSDSKVTKVSTSYPMALYVSNSNLSLSHKVFLSKVCSTVEPKSFSQAIKYPHWRAAMTTEIEALEKNNTWNLVSLPSSNKPIVCKWVFKVKYHSDGSIERYKTRLVAKGYNQIEGLDYHNTFAPMAKLVTIRLLLSIAAIKGNDSIRIQQLKSFLEQKFYIKALGKLKYFLGIEVARSQHGLFLSQRKYTMDILEDVGVIGGRIFEFPMEQNINLATDNGVLLPEPTIYR